MHYHKLELLQVLLSCPLNLVLLFTDLTRNGVFHTKNAKK